MAERIEARALAASVRAEVLSPSAGRCRQRRYRRTCWLATYGCTWHQKRSLLLNDATCRYVRIGLGLTKCLFLSIDGRMLVRISLGIMKKCLFFSIDGRMLVRVSLGIMKKCLFFSMDGITL